MTRLLIVICFAFVSCKRPVDNFTQHVDASPKADSVIVDLREETLEKMQGTWIHMEDSLSIVKIKGDKWTFEYKGIETASVDSFDIQLTDTLTLYAKKDEKSIFLLLTNKDNELDYEILTLTDDILRLMYFPRGNTHTYKRVE